MPRRSAFVPPAWPGDTRLRPGSRLPEAPVEGMIRTAVRRRPVQGFGDLVFYWTDAETQAEINTVGTFISDLNRDFSLQTTADPNLRDAWLSFFREWGDWRSLQDPTSWANVGVYGNTQMVEKAREYGRRAEDFRRLFAAAGGNPTVPEKVAPPPPPGPASWIEQLTGLVKWGAIGIGALGAVYLVVKITGRKPAKAAKAAEAAA